METKISNLVVSNVKENFVSYIILVLTAVIIVISLIYYYYVRNLENSECTSLTALYGTLDGYLHSLNPNDSNNQYNLFDYYIKTAYNCCSGGSYTNDFVSVCILKNILKQGVRALDFEIYSIDNNPVVATSTVDNYYVKETYNSVKFSDVMYTIVNYAFSNSTAPNPSDPIIIHLRIKSYNQEMYTNFATLLESYSQYLLGKDYSYESYGHNLGKIPLMQLMGKIIIIVDRINTSFLENEKFLEFINLTSNSIFMRAMSYYDIQNSPDITELQEYNKTSMTIAMPNIESNPQNVNTTVVRDAGCQFIAMRYQYIDSFLEDNTAFFDESGYAFVLKPDNLRYIPVVVKDPPPQDPSLNYATRNVGTDYYNFNI
jgi:hypothetical protein